MILMQIRKILLLGVIVVAATPVIGHAQLGLGGRVGATADYEQRANIYMSNRGLAEQYRAGIRGNTTLFGRHFGAMQRQNRQSLILDPQYGVFRRGLGAVDPAGRWLKTYQIFDLESDIARLSSDMAQATDYLDTPDLDWTKDEVLATLRQRRTGLTLALSDPTDAPGTANRMASNLQSRAESSYRSCLSLFRDALAEKKTGDRHRLITEARNAAELVMMLDNENPKPFLVEALIAYIATDFNTSLINLEQGLRRAESLEAAQVDTKTLFGDSGEWEDMLESVNLAFRTSKNPRIKLFQAYLAFLSGDLYGARDAANLAVEDLERQLRENTEADEQLDESAGFSGLSSLDVARHFRDLLVNHFDSRSENK